MRQFHVSKEPVTFLDWPITPANLFRIFCHLRRMCLESFTLTNFVSSYPMKTNIRSVRFSAAMIITRSVFCTVRVNFSRLHVIFLGFLRVINPVTITSIIKQYHRTKTLSIVCITSVQVNHNGRLKLTLQH
jgi:hypothetical protein